MKPKLLTIVLIAAVAITAAGLVFWQRSHRIETPAAAQSAAPVTPSVHKH